MNSPHRRGSWRAQAPGHLKSVEGGKHDAEHYQIGVGAKSLFETTFPVVGTSYLVAFVAQEFGQQRAQLHVIIDHKNVHDSNLASAKVVLRMLYTHLHRRDTSFTLPPYSWLRRQIAMNFRQRVAGIAAATVLMTGVTFA